MKIEFTEYDDDFNVELITETSEEILRVARLGLTAKKGARVFINFGQGSARIGLSFTKHKNKYPSIRK
jgi:hypothetical protein